MIPTTNQLQVEKSELSLEEIGSDGAGTGLETELLDPSGSIQAPFDPAKIDVVTQQRTISLLLTRLEEGEMDLSPEFQRRGNLWNERRKSGLVESIILRIPIPSLYVAEDKDGNYTVVDGLQRMCAIAHFVNVDALNKAVDASLSPLRLSGLQSLGEDFLGKCYGDLPRPLRRRIDETELTLHIIRASTPEEVKFNIFSRINQGGLPLTSQEIRNAIYRGEWRRQVKGLAESKEFKGATEGRIRGERMEDIELVLRFAAHYAMPEGEVRPEAQNLDDFLNQFVKCQVASWSKSDWATLANDFKKAMSFSSRIFGKYAFRKYYGKSYYRNPINRGLFEAESVILAKFREPELEILAERQESVLERLAMLFANPEFNSALLYATGRGSSSNTRLHHLMKALNEVLSA